MICVTPSPRGWRVHVLVPLLSVCCVVERLSSALGPARGVTRDPRGLCPAALCVRDGRIRRPERLGDGGLYSTRAPGARGCPPPCPSGASGARRGGAAGR